MGTITLLIVAVGLAMDAFTVAIATGIALGCVTGRQAFRLAFHFGFFQFIMPVIGWTAGYAVETYIQSFDHWVALALLCLIGGKMIVESFERKPEKRFRGDPTKGMTLFALSVATSIDALAVGLSLGVLHQGIWYPSVIIGFVAAAFTVLGLELGCKIGLLFSSRIVANWGINLLGVGIKIVLDHTVFAG